MSSKGKLVILSGPSGGGKSTLIQKFLEEFEQFSFPTSATTRKPRPGEKEGEAYYFLELDDFNERIQADEFLEHANVFGNLYGTLKSTVAKALDEGKLMIKDIDVQGACSLMDTLQPDLLVTIFIEPPSLDVLRKRLNDRNTENADDFEKRTAKAEKEMAYKNQFTHHLVNDDLEKAYHEFKAILAPLASS